jgi:hypothetical protein
MTPEQRAWDSLRPVLAEARLDPRRVENVVGPGHPDVNYAGGDIELKAMEAFPKRDATLVKVPKFTGEQAGWLYQRQQAGARAWLLVRVKDEWFLFNGIGAMQVYQGLSQFHWRQRATLSGRMRDIRPRLLDALRGQV